MSLLDFFRRKPPLDPDTSSWIVETVEWLLRNLGGYEEFRRTTIVTPTNEFFPPKGLRGHPLAIELFTCVKEHAHMADWPCEVQQQEEDPPDAISPAMQIVHSSEAPLGTFSISENENIAVISYNPRLLNDRMALVATFAHELSHYLTLSIEEPPPGGWECLEPATDVTAVFVGFGVFLINSAFSFAQFGDSLAIGWRSQRQGYLGEPALLYTHALISKLLDAEAAYSLVHLKPSLAPTFRKMDEFVAQSPAIIEALRNVDSGIKTTVDPTPNGG